MRSAAAAARCGRFLDSPARMRRCRMPRLLLTGALLGSGVLANAGIELARVDAQSRGWSVQATPNVRAHHGELAGVSCRSPQWCVAVGDYVGRNGQQWALAEVRRGSRWSIEKTPSLDGAALSSVS